MGVKWHNPGVGTKDDGWMLLDEFLPEYHFHEVHTRNIHAPSDRIFCAMKELTPREIALFRILTAMRYLPARLTGKSVPSLVKAHSLLDQVLNHGFVLLAEETNRELVVGTVGQFWRLRGSASPKLKDASEFLSFDQPGYAKAAINFLLQNSTRNDSMSVSTETRISVADPIARKKFARYWRVIYPGSALIRRTWLRAIQRRAERS
jgi:hypothetical protein